MEARVHVLELLVVAYGVAAVGGGVDDEDHFGVLEPAQRNELTAPILHREVEDALCKGVGEEQQQEEGSRQLHHHHFAPTIRLDVAKQGDNSQRGWWKGEVKDDLRCCRECSPAKSCPAIVHARFPSLHSSYCPEK